MDNNLNISFIGAGNMARSLIGGLLNTGIHATQIQASDPNQSSLEQLQKDFGISTSNSNQDVISNANIIIFAVKPQILKLVITGLSFDSNTEINKNNKSTNTAALFISIAAGIAEPSIRRWLGFNAAIVRCMPNTPALVAAGATALFANEYVNQQQRQQADAIMAAVGINLWLTHEHDMDTVTALSGSGPAYFYYIMEAMEQAAIEMGLDADSARILCTQTAYGAAKLALESQRAPAELRHNVTSPGGTTEAAISEFKSGGLLPLFSRAMNAAQQRAKSLAKELGE